MVLEVKRLLVKCLKFNKYGSHCDMLGSWNKRANIGPMTYLKAQ